jgi:hypothetical protein
MKPIFQVIALAALLTSGGAVAQTVSLAKPSPPLVQSLGAGWDQPLKPGLYKTEPFSCLVLVPSAQADGRAIVKPKEPSPPMPVVKPDLRFIPWVAKK